MSQNGNAKAYYGYLFEPDKKPTKVLDALLRGIALYISASVGDKEEKHLTPEKLATFYKAVGGNYDSLFVDVPHPSISWIYASIGCQHTHQPTADAFTLPSVPALTTKGFVRWQSIEILLGPEEHVPFIQTAVRNFGIKNPDNGEPFPVDLPKEAFPLEPDAEIEKWHNKCAEKLRQRATPTKEEARPHLPPRPKVQSGYVHIRPVRRADTDYFEPKSRVSSRPLSYQHVSSSGMPVRPRLSRSPSHRARQFLAPEDNSPRLARSRRRSVPEGLGSSPSSPSAQQPELRPPDERHVRPHSHPRQARRGSVSSDASSSSEGESPTHISSRRRRSHLHSSRSEAPPSSVRYTVPPSPSVQAFPSLLDLRLRARGRDLNHEREEELKRKSFPIPIDITGKLSGPFLLGKRSAPRNTSRNGNVRWKDLDSADLFRRTSDEDRSSGGLGGDDRDRGGYKRRERDRERDVRPRLQQRRSSHEDFVRRDRDRDRERETVRGDGRSFREREKDREGRFGSGIRGQKTLPIAADTHSLHLRAVKVEFLITAFASEIYRSVRDTTILEDVRVKRVSEALPRLLKEFSQELVAVSKPGTQKGATKFVRRYRKRIAVSFRETYASLTSRVTDASGDQQATIGEKIARWRFQPPDPMTTYAEYPKDVEQDLKADDDDNFDVEKELPDLAEAAVFLFQSDAFEQLQTRMRTESLLSDRDGQAIQSIRTTILGALDTPDSRFRASSQGPKLRTAKFIVSWNPIEFLRQQYPEVERPAIKDIITMTGSATDAQAVTCELYIRQLWPLSGEDGLLALQMAVDTPGRAYECTLTDGTILDLCLNESILSVTVTGTVLKIADIGEQFAWIGAACRTSHKAESLAFSIIDFEQSPQQFNFFSVKYDIQDLQDSEISQAGACWHQLFKNPVIVPGFPILARDHNERGLEIPLEMMARLGGAERATIYDGQLVIKGFSTMFVPTEQIHNSIMWHFVFNKNEERISYVDAKKRCPSKVVIMTYSCLDSSRNFLGWSTSILLYTGSNDVDYRILRFTGSNLAGPGCALEKITISGGKFITAGGTFTLGNKDTNLRLSGLRPYERQVHEAGRINVILYDVDDRRAWLVDGANALLHMTRATLSQDEFLDNPLLDIKEFSHADPNHGENAAIRALKQIGVQNPILIRDTPIFCQSSSTELKWGVKELVQAHWHILEQIQDYQAAQSGTGIPLRFTDRDKLEGFGFVDIVSGEPNIRPRVAILKTNGRGWVDFARKIQAITLMARGFGELMKPSLTSQQLCRTWKHVPKGQDYLAARVCQLRQICEKFGSIREGSLELVQGLYWHQGGKLFESCKTYTCSSACDRVQTLLPENTLGSKNCPVAFDEVEGAVIFGRSNRFLRWWPRNPKIGPMHDEAACIAEDEHRQSIDALVASFSDSAIGSEDPGASDLLPNQSRGGSVHDTVIVDAGTGMNGKDPVETGSQLNHNIKESRAEASTSTPPTVHTFKDGPQFYTGSDMDGCDEDHTLDLSISPSAVILQPLGVDVSPFRAESATNRVRKRRGVYQLRTSPDYS